MLVGIQQNPSFSAQTYFNYETFLFQCFSTVFGIRPFFEMHRGMWSGHIFSRFHERFWHLVRFRNAQKHVARLYFFSFSLAFLAFVDFKSFWHFAHFRNAQEACAPVIHFSRFHARPQKSYRSKFQKCCPTNIKKTRQEKVFLSSN